MINGTQLVIGSAEVSGYVTKVDWEFSFGTSCHYPSQQSDDDYAPGGLFTLQTMHNVDTYLTARTTEWWHKGETNKCSYAWYTGRFFLEPHDGYPLDEKFLLKTESLAYLLFQSNSLVIDCLSGYRLEIGTIFGLTDQPTLFSSKYPIDPKVDYVSIFGSVVGYRGGDSFVIRAYYDNDSTSPYFYLQVHFLIFKSSIIHLQEDQCSDQEVTHLPEIASILIISNSSSMCSGDPHVTLYSNAPTTLPSSINNAQSFVPTVSLLSRKNSGEKKKSLLLLSILLPIIIVTVIGIVVVVARAYFVAGKGDLIPLSDDSGNNLVFDT